MALDLKNAEQQASARAIGQVPEKPKESPCKTREAQTSQSQSSSLNGNLAKAKDTERPSAPTELLKKDIEDIWDKAMAQGQKMALDKKNAEQQASARAMEKSKETTKAQVSEKPREISKKQVSEKPKEAFKVQGSEQCKETPEKQLS